MLDPHSFLPPTSIKFFILSTINHQLVTPKLPPQTVGPRCYGHEKRPPPPEALKFLSLCVCVLVLVTIIMFILQWFLLFHVWFGLLRGLLLGLGCRKFVLKVFIEMPQRILDDRDGVLSEILLRVAANKTLTSSQ